jgi:Flp pilus assembly pilin Flp
VDVFAVLLPAARRVRNFIWRIARDRRGIESVEYAVIAAVVITIAVRSYGALSYSGIGAFFKGLATGFSTLRINL